MSVKGGGLSLPLFLNIIGVFGKAASFADMKKEGYNWQNLYSK